MTSYWGPSVRALIGSTFLRTTAHLAWLTSLGVLVFDLTGRELDLGLIGLAEFLPVLLLGALAIGVASYVLDESDGEVRVVCDLPLEDGTVTSAQLSRMLTLVAWTVDQFDPVIRLAGTEGKVDFVELDARILQKSPEPRRRKSRSARACTRLA